jgi:hypothetical protein
MATSGEPSGYIPASTTPAEARSGRASFLAPQEQRYGAAVPAVSRQSRGEAQELPVPVPGNESRGSGSLGLVAVVNSMLGRSAPAAAPERPADGGGAPPGRASPGPASTKSKRAAARRGRSLTAAPRNSLAGTSRLFGMFSRSTPISCRELVAMTTTLPRRGELFPQRRDRSIADLATEIAATEASRARWLRVVEVLTEAGRQSRREQAMVGLAERKLQLLHSSYDTLAPRQPPDE